MSSAPAVASRSVTMRLDASLAMVANKVSSILNDLIIASQIEKLTRGFHQSTLRDMKLHRLGRAGPKALIVQVIVTVPHGSMTAILLRGCQDTRSRLRSTSHAIAASASLATGSRGGVDTLDRR